METPANHSVIDRGQRAPYVVCLGVDNPLNGYFWCDPGLAIGGQPYWTSPKGELVGSQKTEKSAHTSRSIIGVANVLGRLLGWPVRIPRTLSVTFGLARIACVLCLKPDRGRGHNIIVRQLARTCKRRKFRRRSVPARKRRCASVKTHVDKPMMDQSLTLICAHLRPAASLQYLVSLERSRISPVRTRVMFFCTQLMSVDSVANTIVDPARRALK